MKNLKIFLDDVRFPVDDTLVICRSYDELVLITAFLTPKRVEFVSFDHDLGQTKSGLDCAKWLVQQDMDYSIFADDFTFYVHSQNPVGAENIRFYLTSYLNMKKFDKG